MRTRAFRTGRRALRVACIALASLMGAAPAALAQSAPATASALARVRSSGELRVGIDATYPPFGSAEGGEFSGCDVDIARAVARQLKVRAVLVNASFDGVFPALQNGTFDVVISAVTITPERSATMLFSEPYINAAQALAVRADSAIGGLDDLTGKTVAVQINTTAQFAMEKRAGVAIAKCNTIDLALLDLHNGRVDAVVSDGPVLRFMARQSFPGVKTVGKEYTDEAFGIVLLKDSSLVSVIGLTELARTGQELASRYAAPLTIWPLVALLYLALTFPLTRVAQYLERKWRPVTRS